MLCLTPVCGVCVPTYTHVTLLLTYFPCLSLRAPPALTHTCWPFPARMLGDVRPYMHARTLYTCSRLELRVLTRKGLAHDVGLYTEKLREQQGLFWKRLPFSTTSVFSGE